MRLAAVLTPPPTLVRVALEALAPQPEPLLVTSRRGLRRVTAVLPTPPALDVRPEAAAVVPLAQFGSLTPPDADRLLARLDEQCRDRLAFTVHVAGGSALVDEGDQDVWLDLGLGPAEDDALRELFGAVVEGARLAGIFCDRRSFRPRVSVATINDRTTVQVLEATLAGLDALRGFAWVVEQVDLLRGTPEGPVLFQRLRLAP